LLVTVDDPVHSPSVSSDTLWDGDGIELALDAAGNAPAPSASLPAGPLDADDFKFIFALLPSGPSASTLVARPPIPSATLTAHTRITREATTTIYQIDLPWTLLNVVPGSRPTLGLDLQINDRPDPATPKKTYALGDGFSRGLAPARLTRYPLAAPPAPFVTLQWDNTPAWSPTDTNRLHLGLLSDTPLTLTLAADGQPARTLTLDPAPSWQHLTRELPLAPHGTTLTASVPGFPAATLIQVSAADLYAQLHARLTTLLARPGQHPLFTRHLQSIADLAADDWARTQTSRTTFPGRALESLGHFQDILSGLAADTAEWPAYLDGRRSLVIAYTSPTDHTLQYYLLSLPRDWDPDRAYPLFFELHGAGNDHPMASFSDRLSATAKRQDGHGYESPKVYAEIERSGYWVHPFGRGNEGYTGIARVDVLEAYDHAHSLLKIDPDRRYLYGFSMGAGGTFNLAIRTPSRWAAACSIAPATNREPAGTPLTANLALVPFKLLCGEEDHFMKQYRDILADLARHAIHPEARSIPGLGHNYTGALQKEKIDWLKTQVRRRPATFAFVTDDNLTNTCWGLTLFVPDGATEPATARVRREGQTLHLTTTGTSRIALDPSEPDGLGLTGEITVLWNGHTAYTGPAGPLSLDL
jgi:predicted esterase